MPMRSLTLVGIIISMLTGLCLGVLVHLKNRIPAEQQSAKTINDAINQISNHYVESVSQETLSSHALKGMMQGLDEYSSFLDADEFRALQATTTGKFGGIGVQLAVIDGFITITRVTDGTPAADAGLIAQDRIIELNQHPAKGKLLTDIISELRGQPGTDVDLLIQRQDQKTPLVFKLMRAVIELTSVEGHLIAPGYGYVRIAHFQASTDDNLTQVLSQLHKQSPAGLHGLIIDLRNNPGGSLQGAVEVADQFLDTGLIVTTKGRLNSKSARYRATKGDALNGKPIAVLINGASASAAEIVAGALQDQGRAQVLGVQSFGKGSVQTLVPLTNAQALKITTAHYFTPNGHSIHDQGLTPDIVFEGSENELLEKAMNWLKSRKIDIVPVQL